MYSAPRRLESVELRTFLSIRSSAVSKWAPGPPFATAPATRSRPIRAATTRWLMPAASPRCHEIGTPQARARRSPHVLDHRTVGRHRARRNSAPSSTSLGTAASPRRERHRRRLSVIVLLGPWWRVPRRFIVARSTTLGHVHDLEVRGGMGQVIWLCGRARRERRCRRLAVLQQDVHFPHRSAARVDQQGPLVDLRANSGRVDMSTPAQRNFGTGPSVVRLTAASAGVTNV